MLFGPKCTPARRLGECKSALVAVPARVYIASRKRVPGSVAYAAGATQGDQA